VRALVEGEAVPDADEHVLQLPILATRVVRVVRDDDAHARLGRERRGLLDEPVVVGQEVMLELEEEVVDEQLGVATRDAGCARPVAGQQTPRDLAVAAAR
jgi:hypothetical protein